MMRRVTHLLTGLALISSTALLAPATAFAQDAQAPCDAYARTCPALPGQPIDAGAPGQPVQGDTAGQPVQGLTPDQPAQGGGATDVAGTVIGATNTQPAATGAVTGGQAATGAGAATGGAGAGSSSPRTLPFTGADIVLLTLVGAGALAAGAAMVAAGRRRNRGVTAA